MAKDKTEISGLSFTVRRAAARHGLTIRQLNWYIAQGYVTPSVRPPSGQGPTRERLFGPTDLNEIGVIAVLRRAGVSPRRSGEILQLMRGEGVVLPRDGALVGNDKEVWLVDASYHVFDLLRHLQGAFALFLDLGAPGAERKPRRRTSRRWNPEFRVASGVHARSA